ncbi:MAG: glycerophosphodiester phosphodiesterase family protein [Catenisphaera adipataccumulans]|jgi:glycerophosphoryl diester phosphodiesterase|uniref:glycerophosphodiester phosphodiesterase family protein n=1 Tax=Catenisphaera adipataccumulans TaxID=700500 RepID=UPI003D9387D5
MRKRIKIYFNAIDGLLWYQALLAGILAGIGFLVRQLINFLLRSSGHVALTSGDYRFLFTTWQGWLLLAVGLGVLVLYEIIDTNVKIVYCDDLIHRRTKSFRQTFLQAMKASRPLFSRRGVWTIFYMSLLVPLCGIGLTVPATRNLTIPDFITSYIYSQPLLFIGYGAAVAAAAILCIRNLFVFHEIILKGKPVDEALDAAKTLMRRNWKNFLGHIILFTLVLVGIVTVLTLALSGGSYALIQSLHLSTEMTRFWTIFTTLFTAIVGSILSLAMLPLEILEVTILYERYRDEAVYTLPEQPAHVRRRVLVITICLAVCTAGSTVMTMSFDRFFPAASSVGVIAHRTGGKLAFENSAAGIKAAARQGAVGSETDVQRTKDGAYIINHDNTFKRLYGDDRKPSEMTLAEIKQLHDADGHTVPTLAELLKTSKGKVKLYIELKGETADRRMADDVVKMIRKYHMEKQTAVISLKYDVVSYTEKKYPDIETGYLYFAAVGRDEDLQVDDLIIEEEMASNATIERIHEAGKKAIVWTVNDEEMMYNILLSDADDLITDEVKQAVRQKKAIQNRNYYERIWDQMLDF